MGEVRIGTSGWVYPPWRGVFYPKGLTAEEGAVVSVVAAEQRRDQRLVLFAATPIELPEVGDQTPDDFVFAVKGSRFITHMKRLAGHRHRTAELPGLRRARTRSEARPDPVAAATQLPLRRERAREFFEHLPRTTAAAAEVAKRHDERVDPAHTTIDEDRPLRHALEIRHESFAVPEFPELLRDHDIALVVADAAGKFPMIEEVTSGLVYVRLHGHDELYVSGYTDEGLDMWAEKITKWRKKHDVHVYFDNDAKVAAPRDAMELQRRLK